MYCNDFEQISVSGLKFLEWLHFSLSLSFISIQLAWHSKELDSYKEL